MFLTLYQKKWLHEHIKQIAFLLLLVCICYAPTLGHAFLSDDITVIQNNPHIGDLSDAIARPQSALRSILYFVIYSVSGQVPALYRLSNILFHAGSVILLYAIVCALGLELLAFFAASLFAVHPLVIESVTWISGGTYSQYGFFFLAALFFYIIIRRNKVKYIFSLLFFFLAVWSSEKAAAFPMVLVWYELCFFSIKKHLKQIIPYFVIAGGFVVFYVSQVGQRVASLETNFYQKQELLNPFMQIPIAISTYLSLFFVPLGLSFYHSELFYSGGEFVIRCASLLLFIALIGYCYWKHKFVAFWLGFFLIILSPTLTPLPIAWVVAERYVYLGVAGLCVVVAWMLYKLVKSKQTKYIGYFLFVAILLPLIGITFVRNIDWKDQDALWLATGATSPSSPQNHNNLGDLYARQGDLDTAIIEFAKATELNPNYGDAYHNLANTYQQKKDVKNAIKNYKKAISINPNIWQSRLNLAFLLYGQYKFAEAAEQLKAAYKIVPQEPNVRKGLAVVLLKLGKEEEAKAVMGASAIGQ